CRRRRNRPGATTQTDQTSLLLWNRGFNDFVDSKPGQVGRSRRSVILGLKLRHFVLHLSLDQGDHFSHKTVINLAGLVGIRPLH
ncbi:unnamed protein product, partial [Brassica oleracea]